VAEFLSDEWLEVLREIGGGLPEHPGLGATIQYVISASAAGKVNLVVEIVDGRLASAAVAKTKTPDVTVSLAAADALALLRDELDSDVAFMQGRLKVEGDYVRYLDVLRPVRTSAAAAVARATLAARTD
jgi:putative sterol carrier protein